MAIKHSITLSTTEPNNEVGVIKIRQADEQTQTLEVQITENGVPKSYTGLAVYFCAKLGQTAGLGIIEQKLKTEEMTNPANGKLEYTMRAEDWQILGRQKGYFSFRKMKNEHEFIEQFTTRDFTFDVIKSVYSDGLKEVKKDGSTYVWTIEDMVRLFKEYIASGKTDWEGFVEQNREILESVDPGGELLSEIIVARGDAPSLGDRIDSEKDEVLAQTVRIGTEKIFTPEMQGSLYLLDRATPKDQIDKYVAMGFDGAVITLHIDGDDACSLRENMATVISVLDYAKEKGLKTNVCKFHATANRVDLSMTSVQNAYIDRVEELLLALSEYNIDTVYVLNEFGNLFKSQINFCLTTINTVKNLGYRVGVTHEYSDNPNLARIPIIDRMLDVPQLFEQSDVIGLNMYPTITNDWKNATRNDSVHAWSKVYPVMEQLRETFGKPIVFTEAGCYFYYQFLENPASWDPNTLDPQHANEEATRIFWYGLLNDKRIQSLVDGVYSWFLDEVVEPETIGFLKHYNERV